MALYKKDNEQENSRPKRRPVQTILMMTDTQRKDMITCYNDGLDMHTPSLDSIGEKGMRFEKCYTAQPVCGPARSCLFTGYYPHTNGSIANSMPLNALTKTIGQRLTEKGVHCAYIGKWHLDGGDYFGDGLCPEGWDKDYWFDMRNYLDLMTDEDRYLSRQEETVINQDIEAEFTFAHQCSDRAVDFISKYKDEDFLLVVSYDEPHHPFLAPAKYFDPFKDRIHSQYGNVGIDMSSFPEHIQLWAENDGDIDLTARWLMGCNSFVDSEIGRVLKSAEVNLENPCILYTSDHGGGLGSHGIKDKGPTFYDEIANVPLMIQWPGIIHPQSVYPGVVSHVDIVPTLLDIHGCSIPQGLEGNSLLPALKDVKTSIQDHVFMEFTRYEVDHDGFGGFQPMRGITDGRFKLTLSLLSSDEFYDLETDPGEKVNLIGDIDFKKIRNQLHDSLLDWMNETRDPYRGYYWERRSWRKDARPASWKYTGMTRQRKTEDGESQQLDYATGLPIHDYVRLK